jgi:hypothetical protein
MSNFGIIHNRILDVISEGVATKNKTKKKLYKEYIKKLKENKELKDQLSLYNLIENSFIKEDTDLIIIESTIKEEISNLRDKYTPKDLMEANENLLTFIGVNNKEELTENTLYLAINDLIVTETKNPQKTIENYRVIINHIKENKPKEKQTVNKDELIPNSILENLLNDKFNDKYKTKLSETEIKIVESLVSENQIEQEDTLKTIVSECKTIVNEKLQTIEEGDVETKANLVDVKERLLEFEYNPETYSSDVVKLIELKEGLEE